jgi:hypothetical protein
MTKEEQLSFFSNYTGRIDKLEKSMKSLSVNLDNFKVDRQSDDSDEQPRSTDEICRAENEFIDKVWFDRHLSLQYKVENMQETIDPEIWKGALESAQRVIDKYGEDNLGPYSDYEWGIINGKLSALRWILGEEWDMLNT